MSIQNDIKTVIAAGGTLTATHEAIEARWSEWVAAERVPAAQALAEAIVTGEGDLARLEERAIGETQYPSGIRGAAIIQARHRLDVMLTPEIRKSGKLAYEKFQGLFNDAAERLTTAASIANPAAEADTMVGAPQKVQKAYLEARDIEADLDRLHQALAAAARLSGLPVVGTPGLAGLVIDRSGAHRGRVWEAYGDHEHKWVKILATGAALQAPDWDEYEPFTEPLTVVHGGGGGKSFDPNDFEGSDDARHIAAIAASKRTDVFNRYSAAMEALKG